jgi:hypothetical protein
MEWNDRNGGWFCCDIFSIIGAAAFPSSKYFCDGIMVYLYSKKRKIVGELEVRLSVSLQLARNCLNHWNAVNNAQGRRGQKLHRAAGTEVDSTLMLRNQQAVLVATDFWAAPEIKMQKWRDNI